MDDKTRMIPPLFALTAAGITGVIGLIMKVDTIRLLIEILVVLLVFFFFGRLAKEILDMLNKPKKEDVSEEGEVIEKEAAEDAEAGGKEA